MSDSRTQKEVARHARACKIANLQAMMGITAEQSKSAELTAHVNTITSRLFESVLTREERAVADAMGVTYAEAFRAKELRERGSTERADEILNSIDDLTEANAEQARAFEVKDVFGMTKPDIK